MIVPAKRVFVPVTDLVIGDAYRVDSGMGGSFKVKYVGLAPDGRHRFENLDREFRRLLPHFDRTTAELGRAGCGVFNLVPK
jgi:hypothetical protein